MSGLAPAPSPLVSRAPSWSLRGARLCDSACASVFAAMNSTPCSPSSIMVLMALPPPPPTPNTLMTAWQRFSSTIVNLRFPLAFCSVLVIRSSFFRVSVSEKFRQVPLEPVDHPAACLRLRRPVDPLRRARAVLDQSHRGRERGSVHDLDQSPDPDRVPPPEGELEHPLPEVGEALQLRPAPGEH